jgi:hypothetical protein
MTRKEYVVTDDDLQQHANFGSGVMLYHLKENNYITEDQYQELIKKK